jgi:hypothetical protein
MRALSLNVRPLVGHSETLKPQRGIVGGIRTTFWKGKFAENDKYYITSFSTTYTVVLWQGAKTKKS